MAPLHCFILPPTLCRLPIRQGRREMSVPRSNIPLIHQLSSHPTERSVSINIQSCSTFSSHVVFTLRLETLYICHLHMRSFRTTYFKVQCYFGVILSNCIFVLDKRYNESNMVKLSSTDLNQIEGRAFLVDRHDLLFFKVTEALANSGPTGEPIASPSVCS